MADINKGFGKRLRQLIIKSGITQKSLAAEVCITPSALTFHLKGQVPSSPLLVKYASRFGVSVDYLLTGVESLTRHETRKDLMVSDASPFYEIMRDITALPKSRQSVLREIIRLIIEAEKKRL